MHLLKTIDSNRCFTALVYEVIPYYSSTSPQSAGRPDCHMSTVTSRAATPEVMNNAAGAARPRPAEAALSGLPQKAPARRPLTGGGLDGPGPPRRRRRPFRPRTRAAQRPAAATSRSAPHPPGAAGGLPPEAAASAAGERAPTAAARRPSAALRGAAAAEPPPPPTAARALISPRHLGLRSPTNGAGGDETPGSGA